MNLLQGSRSIIYALLIIIAVIACKSGDADVSGLVQPKNQVNSSYFTDSFLIKTSTVLYDSSVANYTKRHLAGVYKDPVFGKVTAHTYTRFALQSTFATFGPNTFADSIKLRFSIDTVLNSTIVGIGSYIVGNRFDTQKYYVHRLTNDLDGSTYYPFSSVAYDPEVLGEVSFSVADSNYRTVTLKKELAEEFVQNVDKFSSLSDFQDFFKGLVLISDANNTCVWGLLDMYITLYYHNYYALNNLVVQESIDINSSSNYEMFSQVTVERKSPLQNLVNNYDSLPSTAAGGACYIQNNSGICTRIQFSDLAAFKARINKKILVNRAELIIKPETTDINLYPLPTSLFAYELDSLGRIKKTTSAINQLLQNELSGIYGVNYPLYSYYNVEKGQYSFVITSYMQSLFDGFEGHTNKKGNYGLMLSASDNLALSTSIYQGYTNINRMVFYNNPNGNQNIKLLLHYTTFE